MSDLARQLLLCLVTAHLLGDFLFQSRRMAAEKHRPGALARHALLHAVLAWAICGAWRAWPLPVGVLVAHGVIDAVKARMRARGLAALLIDQVAHLASLVGIAILVARGGPELVGFELWGAAYPRLLIVISSVVVTVFAGGIVVGVAVRPLRREIGELERRGLESGGRLIGQLERGLILLFVLTGSPASIGFLIAAKSIFRFGELREQKNRMEAEYILIGTMMSFTYALLAAHATRLLLELSWTA